MNETLTDGRELGRRLRSYRLNRLWTLKRMSRKCGLPAATLSKLENGGSRKPHDLTVARLKIKIPDLFDETLLPAISQPQYRDST